MAFSLVPATGLSLSGAPDTEIGIHKPQHKPLQAFKVELPVALAEELRKHAAGKGNGIQLTCGRSPVLKIGGKPHDLSSTPQTVRRELYSSKEGSKLSFAAMMSHRLQLQKVEKVTKGADAALLALQSNMAALEKEKKSNTTLFVKDRSSLGIPEPGKVKHNKARRATHSKPTSPSLGSSQPSTARLPTSAPLDHRTLKTQALRRALIHLLAIKPAREETLIQKTRGSTAECVEILEKCAERCESDTKWQLDKRSYRELDVWRFPYPSRQDRQAAIDHAATAYDRLRLSREDKLWQMLLPERERGKGKILSKLSLHNGPIGRSNTPTIKVQRTADSPPADSDDQRKSDASDSDPKSRKLAPAARSREGSESEPSQSPTPMNRKKLSEREALSKRLLSKKPKKQPTRPAEKAKAGKTSGRVEKASGKIKSAEYIEDSSDEAEPIDKGEAKPANSDGDDPAESANMLAALKQAKATKTGLYSKITKPSVSGTKAILTGVKTGRVEKSAQPTTAAKSKATALPAKPQSATVKSASSSSASRDDLQKKTAATTVKAKPADKSPSAAYQSSKKRPPTTTTTTTTTTTAKSSRDKKPSASYPHKATKTTSKPSPLGSSPPTNASDFESAADDSSSSSTPLISQVRRNQAAQSRSSNPHTATQRADPAPKVNGIKRKANENDDDRHQETIKRRQPSRISSPPPSSSSSSAAALNNSYSSSSSSSSSSSASPPTSYHVLQLAKKFKDYYAGYERLYSELVRMADPPAEKVKRVKEMHSRLEGMKMEISRSAAS